MKRFRRSKRGVLEGLPLTLIISVVIIIIGTGILMSLYFYAQGRHLSTIYVVQGPGRQQVNGWLPMWYNSLHFEVTTVAAAGGGLAGVIVNVNGSGIDVQAPTASNGTVMFLLPPPTLPEHATNGLLTITATYSPPPTLGSSSADETASVSEVILS